MGLVNCDVLIVGAGIVGLSAGLALRKLSDQTRITIIDRSPFSDGGSTRNAGFACFGSPRELLDDVAAHGLDTMLENVTRRLRGLALLRAELGDSNIGYVPSGSLELAFDGQHDQFPATNPEEIAWLNAQLASVTGRPDTFIPAPDAAIRGVAVGGAASIWFSPLEGMLETSRLILTLEQRAAQVGIIIRRGLHVSALRLQPDGTSELDLQPAFSPPGTTLTIRPPDTLLTINGLTGTLIGNADVERAPNQVIVTEPITGLLPSCPIHAESGYIYARPLPSGQLLIGGGRHWPDLSPEAREQHLLSWLRRAIPAAASAQPVMRWTGYLGVGPSKQTRIETIAPHTFGAWRLGGIGVATGMEVGRELAYLSRK
jgi:glycine/D-amino acid oxidase-like deaminating enzyme